MSVLVLKKGLSRKIKVFVSKTSFVYITRFGATFLNFTCNTMFCGTASLKKKHQ